MGLRIRLRRDGPDGTLISRRIFILNGVRHSNVWCVVPFANTNGTEFSGGNHTISRWLRNCIGVVVIPWVLGQQEDVLVRLCGPIRHAFRHRVRFMPNNVSAQIPAVRLKSEGDTPRDADKILGLQSFDTATRIPGLSLFQPTLVVVPTSAARTVVTVTQVQPDCPVWPQHLANPAEHLDQLRDVLLRCLLQPDLSFDAVIPKAEVGWRRDHALHRLRRQDVGHALSLVAVNDGHLRRLLFSASSLFLRYPRVRLRSTTI